MADPFEVCDQHLALRYHFSQEKYEYQKYNGKSGLKMSAFLKRRDRFGYNALSNKPRKEIFETLLANTLETPKFLIFDLKPDLRLQYLTRTESIEYNMFSELNGLLLNVTSRSQFQQMFKSINNDFPLIAKGIIGKKLRLETVLALDTQIPVLSTLRKEAPIPAIWESFDMKLRKYRPFLTINTDQVRKYFSEAISHFM